MESKVLIRIDKHVHQAIIVDARRKGRSAVEEMRYRIEAPYVGPATTACEPVEPIRAKRPNGAISGFSDRLFIPIWPALKCDFMRRAREAGVSQAELGLVMVQLALTHEDELSAAIGEYVKQGRRAWGGLTQARYQKGLG